MARFGLSVLRWVVILDRWAAVSFGAVDIILFVNAQYLHPDWVGEARAFLLWRAGFFAVGWAIRSRALRWYEYGSEFNAAAELLAHAGRGLLTVAGMGLLGSGIQVAQFILGPRLEDSLRQKARDIR